MIIGGKNLKQLFPEFEDDVKENGIDLRIGKIRKIHSDEETGCANDEKILPEYEEVLPSDMDNCYRLKPNTYYNVVIDRPIYIPDGYVQLYYLRSTFMRCGLLLISSVGDNGFNGHLMMGLYNTSKNDIIVGANERIIQAITIKNDGSAFLYNGTYQEMEE